MKLTEQYEDKIPDHILAVMVYNYDGDETDPEYQDALQRLRQIGAAPGSEGFRRLLGIAGIL